MSDEPKYLRLGDGSLIDMATGRPAVSTEINKAFSDKPETSMLEQGKERVSFSHEKRRYLDDLPGTESQTKAVAMICALSVYGLNTADIAYLVRQDIETVEAIKDSAPYQKLLNGMLQQLREHDTNKVRKRINKEAINAAQKMADFVDHLDPKISLAASKDILDRAERGYGNQGENSATQGSLTIRIIDDRDNPADKIDVEIDG